MAEANKAIFLHQKLGTRNQRTFANCELGMAIGSQIKDEEGQEAFNEFNNKYNSILI